MFVINMIASCDYGKARLMNLQYYLTISLIYIYSVLSSSYKELGPLALIKNVPGG
jgi:hypothetical protein